MKRTGGGNRISTADVHQVILKGRRVLPSFSHLSETRRNAIVDFLEDKASVAQSRLEVSKAALYQYTGYNRWHDANGYPVSTPPC